MAKVTSLAWIFGQSDIYVNNMPRKLYSDGNLFAIPTDNTEPPIMGCSSRSSILGRTTTTTSSSRPPLLPSHDNDNAAAAIAPLLQILPPGSGTIVGSHLAVIDGHLRHCQWDDVGRGQQLGLGEGQGRMQQSVRFVAYHWYLTDN